MRLDNFSIRFLAGSLTLAAATAVTLVMVLFLVRNVNPGGPANAADFNQEQEFILPEGWKELDIKGRVLMGLPQDMKPAELLGDSFAYREAYRNSEMYITIVYGEISPNRNERDPPVDACHTPGSLINQPTFQESVITVHGRKARLAIDRSLQSKKVSASVCFHPDERGVQLIVAAYCKDEQAFETARKIFASLRFKE